MKTLQLIILLTICVVLAACTHSRKEPVINPVALANAQRIDSIKTMIENNNISQAQEQLTSAFADGFQHPMAYYLQGLIHFNVDQRKRYAQSIEWFEKAISASPQWLEPRLFLARACIKDQRLFRAQQVFEEINHLAAHSAVGPYGLALIDSMNGKTASAVKYCDEALQRNQWHEATILLRARLAARQNNVEQQRKYYQRLVYINPLQAEAHYALGEISLSSGRHADAQRSFERSYELIPNAKTARQLADLAVHRKDEQARRLWLKRAGNAKSVDFIDNDGIE
ncbi:MAG: tetratricopeptide repeat protein [Planctomycetes bacterium]|nr:tetratricopeptide repeat protein [Planctomycetota bacterium]